MVNKARSIQQEIKSRECLLSSGAEYFVIQFAIQKYKFCLLFCMGVKLGLSR
jgi:hypothetical protein